ncbi:MAG: hypothetical protein IPH50_03020 [Rhodanobacteraceae bacterium]|nr:hypothetical protein [Rhodanobacteraceae bacterium]
MIRKRRARNPLGLMACLCAGTATAVVTNRMRLDTLDVYRGLPANSVRAVLSDHDGFIWVGTQDGLARYDGEHVDLWRHRRKDAASLSESSVVALAEDDDGQLYVAHPVAGISVMNRSRSLLSHWRVASHGLASDRITSLRRAGDGRIWVLFQSGEVQWLDRVSQRAVTVPEINLRDLGVVRAIGAGPAGGLWLASEKGLWRLEAGKPQVFRDTRLGAATTNQTRVLLEDSSGALWVGASDGLWRLAHDGLQRIELPFATQEDAERPEVESLLLDQVNRLWIGTRRGAFIYDRARQAVVERLDHDQSDRQSLGSSRVTTLAPGR